ncbi:MAG: cyclic nucleotide-binding domain-containing protein, partial [Pirellulaceae bacterium]
MRKILFLMSHLNESDLDWIAASGETRTVKAGTVIIEKGKPIDALYIILDGTLEVLDADIDGKPIQVG